MSAAPLSAIETRAGEAAAFVAGALAEHAGSARTVLVSVPAPLMPPESLLRLSTRPCGLVWDPPAGWSFAGVGAVHRFELSGSDRFARLRRETEPLWARIVEIAHPACQPPRPRLFGGFAFAVGGADETPWSELGDGAFTLPRFTYARRGEEAILTLAVRAETELASGAASWADELGTLLDQLEGSMPVEAPIVPALGVERPSVEDWRAQIEAIRAAIAAGRFAKIVAAGRSVVEVGGRVDAADLLGRLARGLRASTRFAFCRERSAFLGASPERLISRRGLAIETESLAGSIESGAEHARQLLGSGKDLHEHQLVVDEIVHRLAPLCRRLVVPASPQIRELKSVLHLHTPISGELAAPRHVLELVERLHPTPAVGGVPTEEAVRWIVDHEPAPRGWYSGPIGWLDAAGDGEFAVALRSCLLAEGRAYVYAGAGIVRDSDPELEYVETELKKQPLLAALGACD